MPTWRMLSAILRSIAVLAPGMPGTLLLWAVVLLGTVAAHTDPAVAAVGEATAFRAVEPCRLVDTRDARRRVPAGRAVEVEVAGRCGVPEDARAVAVTITAVRPDEAGFLTAYPSGSGRPDTSTLNFRAGAVVANLQLLRVGDDGSLRVYTTARTDVLVDVSGAFVPAVGPVSAGRYVPVDAKRVLDTRGGRRPAPGRTHVVQTGAPDGAVAAVVNVTITSTTGRSFVTAHAPDSVLPEASVVNADGPGQVRAAAAVVPVTNGAFALYTSGANHVVVDVRGYFTGADAAAGRDGLFVPIDPVRLTDTRRPAGATGGPRLHDDGAREFSVAKGVGAEAGAVVLNVTLTRTEDRGFVVVHPAGTDPGQTSSVNGESARSTVANLVVTPISERGVTVTTLEATHVVLDAVGWFTGSRQAATGPVPSNDLPPRRRVVIVGDSSFAGMRWNGALGGLQGMRAEPRLDSCRRLVSPSCRGREGFAPRTVQSELLAMAPAGPEDLLVVTTGYNDWHEGFAADFDVVVATARSRGFRHIAWVTYRSDVGYILPGGGVSNYEAMNGLLFAKAASGEYPEVRLWDYDADTAGPPEGWFYSDGVHERTLGSWGTADWISRQVAAFDERPCPQPWAPGEAVADPCPTPGTVLATGRGAPDIAGLYGL